LSPPFIAKESGGIMRGFDMVEKCEAHIQGLPSESSRIMLAINASSNQLQKIVALMIERSFLLLSKLTTAFQLGLCKPELSHLSL
jgi:hypothetical protein